MFHKGLLPLKKIEKCSPARCTGASALLMMAENAIFPSVWAGESRAWNPIGSAVDGYTVIQFPESREGKTS